MSELDHLDGISYTIKELDFDEDFHCSVNVTLADGSCKSFSETGTTRKDARRLSLSNARHWVNMSISNQRSGSNSESGDESNCDIPNDSADIELDCTKKSETPKPLQFNFAPDHECDSESSHATGPPMKLTFQSVPEDKSSEHHSSSSPSEPHQNSSDEQYNSCSDGEILPCKPQPAVHRVQNSKPFRDSVQPEHLRETKRYLSKRKIDTMNGIREPCPEGSGGDSDAEKQRSDLNKKLYISKRKRMDRKRYPPSCSEPESHGPEPLRSFSNKMEGTASASFHRDIPLPHPDTHASQGIIHHQNVYANGVTEAVFPAGSHPYFHEGTYKANGTMPHFVDNNGQPPNHGANGPVHGGYIGPMQLSGENFPPFPPHPSTSLPIPPHLLSNVGPHHFAPNEPQHMPPNGTSGYPLTGGPVPVLHTQSQIHPHCVPHGPPPPVFLPTMAAPPGYMPMVPNKGVAHPGMPPPNMSHASMVSGADRAYPFQREYVNPNTYSQYSQMQERFPMPPQHGYKEFPQQNTGFPMPSQKDAEEFARQMALEEAERRAAHDAALLCNEKGSEQVIPNNDLPKVTIQAGRGKGSTKSTRNFSKKSKPRAHNKIIVVDDVPSDEEEDGVDHVSFLNKTVQRDKGYKNLDFSFKHVRAKSPYGPTGWECTACVSYLPVDGPTQIVRSFIARNQKKAKQGAARNVLVALKNLDIPESKTKPTLINNLPVETCDTFQGITTATAALHQLWQMKILLHQPDYDFETVNGCEGEAWRCIVVVKVAERGVLQFSHDASTKKESKKEVAVEALKGLLEQKVPGVDIFSSILKKKDPVVEVDGPKNLGEELVEDGEAIVQFSDDEGSNGSVEICEELENKFVFPKGYKLIIASTEEECNIWFEKNGQPGAELGVFIDSWSGRKIFEESGLRLRMTKAGENVPFPMLCFSTAETGIVIQRRKGVHAPGTGKSCDEDYWLPEVVVEALEDTATSKHGHSLDDGVNALETTAEIFVACLSDIAFTSHVINNVSKPGSSKFMTLRELVKHWLQKDLSVLGKAETIWSDESDAPLQILKQDGKEMLSGILASYACFCVKKRMSHAARKMRTQIFGTGPEFLELSKRLTEVIKH